MAEVMDKIADMNSDQESERPDYLLIVLSVLLLVAMGLATLYHLHYGKVDQSVMPGSVTFRQDGSTVLALSIDEEMHATVSYRGVRMRGTLYLDGAEEDTVLYVLREAEFLDGRDPEGLAFLVRVPRSGLAGDGVGPWMAYYSYPPAGELVSDWIFIEEDGSARVGRSNSTNPMTALRKTLLEQTTRTSWARGPNGAIVLGATT